MEGLGRRRCDVHRTQADELRPHAPVCPLRPARDCAAHPGRARRLGVVPAVDRAVRRAAAAIDARRGPGRGRDPAVLPPAPRRHRRRRPGARACSHGAAVRPLGRAVPACVPDVPGRSRGARSRRAGVGLERGHRAEGRFRCEAARRVRSRARGRHALPPRRARVLLAHHDASALGPRRRDRARRGPVGRPVGPARARHGRRARLDRRGLRRDRGDLRDSRARAFAAKSPTSDASTPTSTSPDSSGTARRPRPRTTAPRPTASSSDTESATRRGSG